MDNTEKNFEERLKKFPALQSRFEEILNIIETDGENILTANQAEERTITTLQHLGNDVLSNWAQESEHSISKNKSKHYGKCHEKKNSIGTQHTEKLK